MRYSENFQGLFSCQTQATAQRLDAADDVIENIGTREMLKASVLKLHLMYLSLSKQD